MMGVCMECPLLRDELNAKVEENAVEFAWAFLSPDPSELPRPVVDVAVLPPAVVCDVSPSKKKRGKKQKSVQPAKAKQPTRPKIKATDPANYYSHTAPDFTPWSCAKQVQAGTLDVRTCFFLKALSVDKNNILSGLRLTEMEHGSTLRGFTFYWNLSHRSDIAENLRSYAKYKCLHRYNSY
jgi:hypothetical protein